jgi:hypothetical protein
MPLNAMEAAIRPSPSICISHNPDATPLGAAARRFDKVLRSNVRGFGLGYTGTCEIQYLEGSANLTCHHNKES